MQFLAIKDSLKLSELSGIVGARNIDSILNLNQTPRVPNIGQAFKNTCNNVINTYKQPTPSGEVPTVSWQRKQSLLNQLSTSSDVFEVAAMQGEDGWILLSELSTLSSHLRIPESVVLPDSADVIGNNVPVSNTVYTRVMEDLSRPPHTINADVFGEYSTIRPSLSAYSGGADSGAAFSEFQIPWGKVSLYSSLSDDSRDIPVYPEELSDKKTATYTQMPDMLYQYEPWQIYTGSGPRSNSYTFNFHRDMWSGDHTIEVGGANDLIRFCEANCYPRYQGSAVYTSLVTLYINGKDLITGVMTDVSVDWSGPLGQDGWYLMCKLVITITEVATEALNYDAIRTKPLIG